MGTPAIPKPAAPAAPPAPPAPAPPQAARTSKSGSLALLVVRSGALKGQRFAIKTPVVNIGRADYNDVVITDERTAKSHDFCYEGGIVSFVEHLNRARAPLHKPPIYVSGERPMPG